MKMAFVCLNFQKLQINNQIVTKKSKISKIFVHKLVKK